MPTAGEYVGAILLSAKCSGAHETEGLSSFLLLRYFTPIFFHVTLQRYVEER